MCSLFLSVSLFGQANFSLLSWNIQDFGKTKDVKVFPNPTDGNIAIQLNFDIQGAAQLRLTDLTGKTVLENRAFDKVTELNLNHLAIQKPFATHHRFG